MRKTIYYKLVILKYHFMNILENKLYTMFCYKIIRYSRASYGVATSSCKSKVPSIPDGMRNTETPCYLTYSIE